MIFRQIGPSRYQEACKRGWRRSSSCIQIVSNEHERARTRLCLTWLQQWFCRKVNFKCVGEVQRRGRPCDEICKLLRLQALFSLFSCPIDSAIARSDRSFIVPAVTSLGSGSNCGVAWHYQPRERFLNNRYGGYWILFWPVDIPISRLLNRDLLMKLSGSRTV